MRHADNLSGHGGGLCVEVVPVGELSSDPANVRRHPDRNLEAIKASLRRFGQQKPIVVDLNGVVRAGNGTLEAVRDLGWTKIAIVRTDLAGSEATAYSIADNRAAELAEWDEQGLAAILKSLESEGFDFDAVGYTRDELDNLITSTVDDPGEREIGEDIGAQLDRAEELLAKWRVMAGDLWIIPSKAKAGSEHRLLCGNSTNAVDIDCVMGGELANILITSPPYNQSIDKFRPSGMMKESNWMDKVSRLAYEDSLPEGKYQDGQRMSLATWFEFMADGSSVFYNHKNRYRDKQVISPMNWLPGPFKFRQEIVWSRPGSITQNARMFIPTDERIYWLYRGDDFYFDDSVENKSFSTVWNMTFDVNPDHPAAFPVELPRRCLKACSRHGDVVFDPHAGSGTTFIVAEQMGRVFRGIEIMPKFCALILERVEGMGLSPRRGETSQAST